MKWLLVLLLGAGVAGAAPVLDVRARTRVTIEQVVRVGAGVHVRGTLVDAGTGEGVTGRDIAVLADESSRPATTGRGGRFDAFVELAAGRHLIGARFPGDEIYGEAVFDPRAFDVDRAGLALDVKVAPAVDATLATVPATIAASSEEGPVRVHVTVRAGEASGPAALRAVADATTGEDGVAHVDLPREKLGHPGDKRILVRFDGSDAFNPVEAEATFTLYTATHFSDLAGPPATLAFEKEVRVTGKLLDAEGKAVAGALLTLSAGDRALVDSVSDGKGRFALHLAASQLGPGAAALVVEHVSTLAWRRGTRSVPMPVTIARPRPVPAWVTLAASAATALLALGYVLLRTRPWRWLAQVLRARRRRPEADAPAAPQPDAEAPAAGLKLARPGLISSLRRAADHGFSGRVRDVVRGVPVAGARLAFALADHAPALEIVSDAAGHFEAELPPGMWHVEVSAHGYVTETVTAPIPHRGELRGARIDLLPVRERVFALYREVAAPLLPKADLWGIWTPREILDHIRTRRPAGALGALTDLVEQAYFAERVPDEEVVRAATDAVHAARAELTG